MVVVDAVDHRRIAFDVGMPAGARAAVVQNRPGDVLGQAALDLEHDRLALLLIGLHRLLLEQFVEVAVATAVVVAGGGERTASRHACDRGRIARTLPFWPALEPRL